MYQSVLVDTIKTFILIHVKLVLVHVNNVSESQPFVQDAFLQLKILNIFITQRAIVHVQVVLSQMDSIVLYVIQLLIVLLVQLLQQIALLVLLQQMELKCI